MNPEVQAMFDRLLQGLKEAEDRAEEWQAKAHAAEEARHTDALARREADLVELRKRFRLNIATELLAASQWETNENMSAEANTRLNCRAALAATDILLEEAEQ